MDENEGIQPIYPRHVRVGRQGQRLEEKVYTKSAAHPSFLRLAARMDCRFSSRTCLNLGHSIMFTRSKYASWAHQQTERTNQVTSALHPPTQIRETDKRTTAQKPVTHTERAWAYSGQGNKGVTGSWQRSLPDRTRHAMRRKFMARRCRCVMWMSSMMAMASKHWHK